MAIIQITTDILGETGVNPRTVRIVCTDILSTVTTPGYLNPTVLQGYTILPTDFVLVMYDANSDRLENITSVTPGIFIPTISNGIITLSLLPDSSGGVTLPVVDGDFAVFSGTSGLIKDAGYAPSDPTLNSVVMTENSGNFVSHIAVFNDTSGTIFSDAATAINGGDIQAGDPAHGANGRFISSYGGVNGRFIITGAANISPVDTTLTNAPMGQATVISIPDPGSSTANVLLSSSSSTQHITTGNFEVDHGNFIAGSNGNSGSFISFPSVINQGMLSIAATPIPADHTVILTNSSAFGQTTTITVPDPSVSNASLLIDNFSGTQHIATGNIEVDAGNIVAGNISSPGSFITYGGSGSGGYLQIACNFLTNPSQIIVTTSDILQSTTFSIGDPGQATASILTSKVVADVGANLISFDVSVSAAALASGGNVTLIASSGSKQYKMRSLYMNASATNFSGGSGDRLGLISDGASTVFSLIPAATMQALENATWGGTDIPFPSGQALNQSSAAGSSIVFQYSGGTADYSTGTVVISGIVERVA